MPRAMASLASSRRLAASGGILAAAGSAATGSGKGVSGAVGASSTNAGTGASTGIGGSALSATAGGTGSTAITFGSQAGHSRTVGEISRPHSGQIQWNMPPMYTDIVLMPFGDTPYQTHLGTLSGIGIRSQGTLRACRNSPRPQQVIDRNCRHQDHGNI